MSGFTPGPWGSASARKVTNHGDWQTKVIARDAIGLTTVATVNSGNGKDNTAEVCEANARLIAAAPEMLEVLRTLAGIADDGGRPSALREHISAIVAKVEGQSPRIAAAGS